MNKFIKMQELRRRKKANLVEEDPSSLDTTREEKDTVNEAPKAKPIKRKKTSIDRGRRDIELYSLKGKFKKKMKENKPLFIDEWHDTCEFLPEDEEDVWFIWEGKIRVGFYEPQQQLFCMADGLGAELRDVRQWKYVGANKQIAIYPKERQIVAISVVGLPCLAIGIFTDHCVDTGTYKEKSGVILDEEYMLIDKIVDFSKVSYWFSLTEPPLAILDPIKDSVLAVFPDEQEVVADKTGVVLDTPPEVEEDFSIETPYAKDVDLVDNQPSDSTVKSAIAKFTREKESFDMVKERLTEKQIDTVRLVESMDNVKEWYCTTYPTDDLGEEIRDDITFEDVFDCLDRYMDIYDCLGVWDSIVRERVFTRLAEIMEVDYEYIYDQWMETKDYPFVKYEEGCKSKKKTRKLKEDFLGWNIPINKVYDAYEELCEYYGRDYINGAIVDSFDTDELKYNLEYLCRDLDYESDFLDPPHNEKEFDDEDLSDIDEDEDEDFEESTKEKANKLKESMNLKQYHLSSLPKELQKDMVDYLYGLKK